MITKIHYNFEIKKLTQLTEKQLQSIHKWEYDSEIRHLNHVFKSEQEYLNVTPFEELKYHFNSFKGSRYGLFLENDFVGEFNFIFDHQALLKKTPKTAWIGIGIGEKRARGVGLGAKAMEYLEREILKAGGERIELGTFEFNIPAQKLYEKMGYKKFRAIPKFTWWNGSWWSDYRYEKNLVPQASQSS